MSRGKRFRAGLVVVVLAAIVVSSGCIVPSTAPPRSAPPPRAVVRQPTPASVRQPAPRPSARASVNVRVPGVTGTAVISGSPVGAGGANASGVISYPGQRVRYPLNITYPRTVSIYIDGHGLDPTVSLYDSFGSRLGFNDDGGSGLDSQLSRSLPPGAYVIEVAGYSSSTGPFTLTVN